jgi:hypothetical protein
MLNGKVTPATRAHALAGPDAADAAPAASGTGGSSQSDASRPLCILRRCRKSSGTAAGTSSHGTLLAQNVKQSKLAWRGSLGAIPADQGKASTAQTKTVPSLSEATGLILDLIQTSDNLKWSGGQIAEPNLNLNCLRPHREDRNRL